MGRVPNISPDKIDWSLFPRLTCIVFPAQNPSGSVVNKIASFCKGIKELYFSSPGNIDDLKDMDCTLFPLLETLVFYYFKIKSESFNQLCAKAKQIKNLVLSEGSFLGDSSLKIDWAYLPNLESLDISGIYADRHFTADDVSRIGRGCSLLRSLNLNMFPVATESDLENIDWTVFKNLEEIFLDFEFYTTKNMIINLGKGVPGLKGLSHATESRQNWSWDGVLDYFPNLEYLAVHHIAEKHINALKAPEKLKFLSVGEVIPGDQPRHFVGDTVEWDKFLALKSFYLKGDPIDATFQNMSKIAGNMETIYILPEVSEQRFPGRAVSWELFKNLSTLCISVQPAVDDEALLASICRDCPKLPYIIQNPNYPDFIYSCKRGITTSPAKLDFFVKKSIMSKARMKKKGKKKFDLDYFSR